MIKKSARSTPKILPKRQSMSSVKVRGVSRINRTTKQRSRNTLRDLLLSKMFVSSLKVLFTVFFVGGVLYGGYSFIDKALANDIVVSKSEIISRVAKLVTLPNENPQDIVRVQDGEALKIQNPLFENVKEGDYIIVYPTLAVVYDLRNNTIVAMKRMEGR